MIPMPTSELDGRPRVVIPPQPPRAGLVCRRRRATRRDLRDRERRHRVGSAGTLWLLAADRTREGLHLLAHRPAENLVSSRMPHERKPLVAARAPDFEPA